MDNAVLEAIKTRRSIRKYKPEQITDEELVQVLDAGTFAPTGKNTQCPFIVAVQPFVPGVASALLGAIGNAFGGIIPAIVASGDMLIMTGAMFMLCSVLTAACVYAASMLRIFQHRIPKAGKNS